MMPPVKILISTLILSFAKSLSCKKYDNYTLYRGVPSNEEHVEFFRNLSDFFEVNFLRDPTTVQSPVDFVVSPEDNQNLLAQANLTGIELKTLIPNIQRAFDSQTVKSYIRRNMESFDWQSYFRLEDIYTWLEDLSKKYPKELKLFSIGKTFEKRNIIAAKIVLKGSKNRSTVIIEGGIHGREWISPAFVTYMLHQILYAPHSKNVRLKNIASKYEWYFVPVINPDGYEYSHSKDRLWRKNRSGKSGVDLNRNFGYGFGRVGVSRNDVFSEIYCGPHPFSELESQAMAKLVQKNQKRLEYYIGFHSYGQYIIIPYADSVEHSDNFDELESVGMEVAKSIKRRYGTTYTIGTAYDTVGYRTSGVSGCWVKKTYSVPYVLTFELRDEGEYAFALPTSLILPTCEETMDGMLTLFNPRTALFKKPNSLGNYSDQTRAVFKIVIFFYVLVFAIVHVD